MNRLALVLAAVLFTVAAAGLSAARDDDYCDSVHPLSETGGGSTSSEYALWPPGRNCVYGYPDGHTETVVVGDAGGFLAMLVGGAVLLARRSRTTWAAAVMFGLGGLGGLEFAWQGANSVAFAFGVPLALLVSRSLKAALIVASAFFVGTFLSLLITSGVGWGVGLVLAALADWRLRPRQDFALRDLVRTPAEF
jgi:hypothetical protein